MLTLSPQSASSPSQAIIRPLPIIRLASPATNKILSSPITSTSSTTMTNGRTSPIIEANTGRSSYRVMPSPSTEERQATYVYLNKNSNFVQQDHSPKEKPSIWQKPNHIHHSHVAYIDEDDEGSVSLKSSTCHSAIATSSSTASPLSTRKDRLQTVSSSSSSNFSHDFRSGAYQTNSMILHESTV